MPILTQQLQNTQMYLKVQFFNLLIFENSIYKPIPPIVFSIDCPQACIEIFAPVCGSDLKTYPNECYLQMEVCEKNSELYILYDGSCNPTTSTTTTESSTTTTRKNYIHRFQNSV